MTISRCSARWFAACIAVVAMGEAPPAALPFTLTWVKGDCARCQGGWWLIDAIFISRTEAWANGANGPAAGFEGMGYRVLLHTGDGGHTWTEVPGTQIYNSGTRVAFLDAKSGWIQIAPLQLPSDGSLLETHNGGASWKNVTGKFPVFPVILDAHHWWGVDDSRQTLMRTADAGRTWAKTPLPTASW